MNTMRYLHLKGIDRPAVFEDATALESLVSNVLPSWSSTWSVAVPEAPPFAVIRPGSKRNWSISIHGGETKEWDAVDTMCDLVAELAWERLRVRPDLLSLHAAAVEVSGRLAVFPDVRRAGKSTLTVALARLGHTVFADDVLPVDIDGPDGRIVGLSSGASPRIRLPLPTGFSRSFKDWAKADPGPANDRYKYITEVKVAPDGDSLPIGTIIILDRQNSPTTPLLQPLGRGDALAQIIRQNFSRDQHSGRILKAVEVLTNQLPLYKLSYSSGEEAAAFLHDSPALHDLPSAKCVPGQATNLAWEAQEKREFDEGLVYGHAGGMVETEVDGEVFLTDQGGAAIHRLNPGSVMIWRTLLEPATLAEVVALLRAAFPDVDPAQIADDAHRTLKRLNKAGLITPVSASDFGPAT